MSGFTNSRSSSGWATTCSRPPLVAGALMLTVALAVPPLSGTALRSTQVRPTELPVPAVKVMRFRPPVVSPAAPPALVMVPPEMVQL